MISTDVPFCPASPFSPFTLTTTQSFHSPFLQVAVAIYNAPGTSSAQTTPFVASLLLHWSSFPVNFAGLYPDFLERSSAVNSTWKLAVSDIFAGVLQSLSTERLLSDLNVRYDIQIIASPPGTESSHIEFLSPVAVPSTVG